VPVNTTAMDDIFSQFIAVIKIGHQKLKEKMQNIEDGQEKL